MVRRKEEVREVSLAEGTDGVGPDITGRIWGMSRKKAPRKVSEAEGTASSFLNQEALKTVKEEEIVISILSFPSHPKSLARAS